MYMYLIGNSIIITIYICFTLPRECFGGFYLVLTCLFLTSDRITKCILWFSVNEHSFTVNNILVCRSCMVLTPARKTFGWITTILCARANTIQERQTRILLTVKECSLTENHKMHFVTRSHVRNKHVKTK